MPLTLRHQPPVSLTDNIAVTRFLSGGRYFYTVLSHCVPARTIADSLPLYIALQNQNMPCTPRTHDVDFEYLRLVDVNSS